MLVRWQGEADLEARRNALRSGHGDEERMEVGAVAFLSIAGVEYVATSPSGSRFVVAHGGENVVIDGARFVEVPTLALCDIGSEIRGQTGNRHQSVGLKILLALLLGERRGDKFASASREGGTLATHDVIFNLKMQFGLSRTRSFRVIHLVVIFRIARFFQRQIALSGNDLNLLIGVGLGRRNPNAHLLSRGQVLHGKAVVECEMARVLSERAVAQQEQRQQQAALTQHRCLPF